MNKVILTVLLYRYLATHNAQMMYSAVLLRRRLRSGTLVDCYRINNIYIPNNIYTCVSIHNGWPAGVLSAL